MKLACRDVIRGDSGTSVARLPGVTTAPDCHGVGKQDAEADPGTDAAAEHLDVQQRADHRRSDDLGKPVEEIIQGSGADGEVGLVDAIHLIGVEPVGGPEHGEEEDDVGPRTDRIPQTHKLRLPAGVLHQNHARAVVSNNLGRIAEEQGEAGTAEHEHDEGDVGAVPDAGARGVDTLAEGNLETSGEPGRVRPMQRNRRRMNIPDCRCTPRH